MAWYGYLLQVFAGMLLANGVPHLVHGISGASFQSPFARPRGVGESSPLVNVLWGFANLAAALVLLRGFNPEGADPFVGWLLVGVGSLFAGIYLALHFGRIRSNRH